MKIKYVVDIMIVLFLVVAGYSQISKGIAYGVSKEKYTKASILKFSKPMGLLTWMLALSVGLVFVGQSELLKPAISIYLMYAGDALVVITALVYYYMAKTTLEKKKVPMGYSFKNNKKKL